MLGLEKREPSYTAGVNVNWYSHDEKQYGDSLKTENRVTIWSSNPTPGHISRKDKNSNSKRYMHPNVYSGTIYNGQDMKATYMSIKRWMDKEYAAYIHIWIYTRFFHKYRIQELEKNTHRSFCRGSAVSEPN